MKSGNTDNELNPITHWPCIPLSDRTNTINGPKTDALWKQTCKTKQTGLHCLQKVLLNLTKRSTNRASPFETESFCLFSQTLHSPLLRTRMSDVYHPRENDRSREQVLGVRFRRRIPSARRSRRTLQLLSFAQYPVITMLQQQESLLLLINHMIRNFFTIWRKWRRGLYYWSRTCSFFSAKGRCEGPFGFWWWRKRRDERQGEMLQQDSVFIFICSILLLCQRRRGENQEITREAGYWLWTKLCYLSSSKDAKTKQLKVFCQSSQWMVASDKWSQHWAAGDYVCGESAAWKQEVVPDISFAVLPSMQCFIDFLDMILAGHTDMILHKWRKPESGFPHLCW
jgi:hypothetical protein